MSGAEQEYEECPVHGPRRVIEVHEGAPSMMGHNFDPDFIDLACGHTLSHDPFTGKPYVRWTRKRQ